MLIVKIHNVSPPSTVPAQLQVCDYDCEVLVTVTPTKLKRIAAAKVLNHRRGDGWRVILRRVADEAVEEG